MLSTSTGAGWGDAAALRGRTLAALSARSEGEKSGSWQQALGGERATAAGGGRGVSFGGEYADLNGEPLPGQKRAPGPYDTDVFLTALNCMYEDSSDEEDTASEKQPAARTGGLEPGATPWFDRHRPAPAVSARQRAAVKRDIKRMRRQNPLLRAAHHPVGPPTKERLRALCIPKTPGGFSVPEGTGTIVMKQNPLAEGDDNEDGQPPHLLDPSTALQDTRDLALYSVVKAASIARRRQEEDETQAREARERLRREERLVPWRRAREAEREVVRRKKEAEERADAAIARRISTVIAARAPAQLEAFATKRRETLEAARRLRESTGSFERGPPR